jgi:hypothetical protein
MAEKYQVSDSTDRKKTVFAKKEITTKEGQFTTTDVKTFIGRHLEDVANERN